MPTASRLRIVTAACAASLVALTAPALPAAAQGAATCAFVAGFDTLRSLAGAQRVGDCLQDQQFDPATGDATQRTTGGLLVWRKADNWTAFTDGFRTWINGPTGLAQRLNSQRFTWESDAGAPGTTLFVPTAQPTDVRAIRAVSTVNVRSGPGQAFSTLGTIPAGRTEAVTGVSPDTQWWRVTCPDGTLGSCWASAAPTLTQPVPVPLDLSGLPGPNQRVDGGAIALTVSAVQRTATPTTTLRAEPGRIYVLVDVIVENPSAAPVPYAPEDFDLRGPEGSDFAAAGGVGPNPLARGQIAPGGNVRGQVAFNIPDDERGLILNFKPNVPFGAFPTLRVALD
jgi:Domain of unknown function (DUF4352)